MEKSVYRFGACVLDPHERRLTVHGKAVTLTPKVFDTLVLLVEQAGHVVSKDELMRTLWPRGFVDESNLTKHIWLIRKALGNGEQDGQWIETVPKLGYRFLAAVERAEAVAAADAETPLVVEVPASRVTAAAEPILTTTPATTAPAQLRRRRVLLTVGALAVVAITIAAYRAWHPLAEPARDAQGSAIAIAGFNNLSQNAKDAWLGPALEEMLATEVAAGGRLHALPDELVRPARSDLQAPIAGGYASDSLATLHKRVGADFVLSGGYLISGQVDPAQLRLDLVLQDARSGAAVATFARNGTVADLNALVTQAGATLREHFGASVASRIELQQIASLQPPTSEVARRIGFALDALHRNDPARARDELLDAIAQAPAYAPAYSYLAQAWSALGYNAKALAAAQQAAAHADGVPQEQRLQIDTQAQVAQNDWPKAIASARRLVQLRADSPEYRYQLISILLSASKPADAQIEFDALSKQVGANGDHPRLELVAARIAAAGERYPEHAEHAERALAQARRIDDLGLIAEAGLQLGIARWHMGDLAAAKPILQQARLDYRRVGNPHGEAWVDQNIGNVYSDTDGPLAREAYQRALAGYQEIGDRNGEAAIYSNLARMLWSSGDLDGAETAVKKSLALRRETADVTGQAWNLAALASIELDGGATDEVADYYREAITLDEQGGARVHRAYTLLQYSDFLRLRGELADASDTCRSARDAYAQASDKDGIAQAEFGCASIALDQNRLDVAQAGLHKASGIADGIDDSMIAINVDTTLAQIAMAQARWNEAATLLQSAIRRSVSAGMVTGEAAAQAQLAICEARRGHAGDRDKAATRARELRSRITEHMEVLGVDIALPQLALDTAQREAATATLRELASDAARRGWLAWSLEARLALLQLLEQGRDSSAIEVRSRLAADARTHGFAWILARMGATPMGSPPA